MKAKNYLLTTGLAALMVASAMSFSAFAAVEGENQQHPPRPENFEEVQEALENGDYDAWKSIIEESHPDAQILEVINESNFDQLVEAHELMQEAHEKTEEARAIFEELGIERPMKPRMGQKMRQRAGDFDGPSAAN